MSSWDERRKRDREELAKCPYPRNDVRHRYWTQWGRNKVPHAGFEELTFIDVWSVVCPRCNSRPGRSCVTHTGYSARTHKPRLKAALEAKRAGLINHESKTQETG